MGGGLRRTASALIIAALLAMPLVAPPRSGARTITACDERSWVAGSTEWCGGTLVYRDHVYDDAGADSGALSPFVGAWKTAGDTDHRTHGQSLNSADLATLRLTIDRGQLRARFELNALQPSDRTFAVIAIDTDNDRATGGGPWGDVRVASDGWDAMLRFDGRDAAANVIEGQVPMPASKAGRVRLQAVVATGDGTPMNVAFRGVEHGMWWEADQASALAAGDISTFGTVVELAEFGRRHTPAAAPTGLHVRVRQTAYPQGEGIVADGIQGQTTARFHFVGRYQPYAVYLPEGGEPHSGQLLLHGAGENHTYLVGQPGAQAVMGDGPNRVLISPLGRGPENSWVDWAARDALDALDDALAHYRIDPDRVVVSGYSMGGQGTMFLATLFPDRFAAAVAWVPFTGDALNGTPLAQGAARPSGLEKVLANNADGCCPTMLQVRGNTIDYLDNLRQVPSAYLFGAADEAVWINHSVAALDRLTGLGYEHRWWLHAGEHVTLANLDDWQKETAWSQGRMRVHRPAHVTYRTNEHLDMPMVDLAADGAYWVSRIVLHSNERTPDGDGIVDLVSHSCSAGRDHAASVDRDAGVDPVPWVGQRAVPDGAPRQTRPSGTISGHLSNVASLHIDPGAACLRPGQEVTLEITSDVRATLHVGSRSFTIPATKVA